MDVTGGADAERPAAIVEHDLRNSAEHEFASRFECQNAGNDHRCDPRANEVSDAAIGRHEAECTVGGRNQSPGETYSLGLIAVEEMIGRAIGQHRRKLPRKIDSVADPGVHALTAGGTVNMRRVTQQEGAASAEMIRHPM